MNLLERLQKQSWDLQKILGPQGLVLGLLARLKSIGFLLDFLTECQSYKISSVPWAYTKNPCLIFGHSYMMITISCNVNESFSLFSFPAEEKNDRVI